MTRRYEAAATQGPILRSALLAFTRYGYDGVGLREIAGAAGVTAHAGRRYLGSKEQPFTKIVEVAFAERTLIANDIESMSQPAATASRSRTAVGGRLPVDAAFGGRLEGARDPARRDRGAFQYPLEVLLPGA